MGFYDVVHKYTGAIQIYTNFAYVMSSSNVSMFNVDHLGPFLQPWISNYTYDKVLDEIANPFPKFNDAVVEL